MWSTPVERQAPDGSKYHLVRADEIETCIFASFMSKSPTYGATCNGAMQVLLDTEGIDAYDQV